MVARASSASAVKSAAIGGAPNILDVEVDEQGDFSPYLISIGWARDGAGVWRYAFDDLDRLFSVAPVNFRPGCPVDFDCKPVDDCPPETLAEPALDYLARDYASFRQMLLDLVAQRNPTWTERSPADVGIALLELFAHEGDHISYFQDAVANEAFLDTARQRVSAKRHAKIVDYQMHDGRNAWTFVHLRVTGAGTIPSGTQLVTKISAPMRFDRQLGVVPAPQPIAPPGTELNVITDEDYRTDPRAGAGARVRDDRAARRRSAATTSCGCTRGATSSAASPRGDDDGAHVRDRAGGRAPARRSARRSRRATTSCSRRCSAPTNGASADADPTHRCVVRVVSVNPDPSTSIVGPASDRMRDKLFLRDIDAVTDEPKRVTVPVPSRRRCRLSKSPGAPRTRRRFRCASRRS